ncbi:50S ribosomal protein L21 [Mucilaginibacter sp. KACC 22063]|uniref:50S ribosomal protein L21 n=1 Tax=Mucilaginibacter sp. KACC 22063 TaxID=3025666 RepID=UPI002366E8FA|nr:50S ribosomal protein L21 [Mucilaginibacter sp. KACC 22063]WDF53583.1 50S ribosomal protein L21 [Mucilaginibacter sp. KACC 22063]
MYAIVNIAGQQFKVAKDQQIFVHRLQGDEGASIEFDKVLLAEDGGKFKLGADLTSAKVSAKIVSHVKGDKVIVFKKKRRKGYKKKNGHRQQFTKIEITGITL